MRVGTPETEVSELVSRAGLPVPAPPFAQRAASVPDRILSAKSLQKLAPTGRGRGNASILAISEATLATSAKNGRIPWVPDGFGAEICEISRNAPDGLWMCQTRFSLSHNHIRVADWRPFYLAISFPPSHSPAANAGHFSVTATVNATERRAPAPSSSASLVCAR